MDFGSWLSWLAGCYSCYTMDVYQANTVFFQTDVWPPGDYEVWLDDGEAVRVCRQTLPTTQDEVEKGFWPTGGCDAADGLADGEFTLNDAGDAIEALTLTDWAPLRSRLRFGGMANCRE